MSNIWLEGQAGPGCEVVMRSDIGRRAEQQDHAYAFQGNETAYAIVCDGMGGAENGALASRLAIDSMRNRLLQYLESGKQIPVQVFLEESLDALDLEVTHRIGRMKGGTTAVMTYLEEGKLYWASVGDSRLYRFRNGEIRQLTRDHNYFLRLDEELKSGEITREYYEQEAEKGEALISFLGIGGISVLDLTKEPQRLQKGDILLLTSDGLYKALPKELIQHVLRSRAALTEKADTLISQIRLMKKTVGLDNTTFILVQIQQWGESS